MTKTISTTTHAPVEPIAPIASAPSIAFEAGAKAKRDGVPLKKSAITALRVGCKQWHDYMDGYESAKRKR